MAAKPEPDQPAVMPDAAAEPAPIAVASGPAVPAGGFVPAEVPVETAEPSKQKPVVLATENHLTRFVVGDVEVTHAGVALSKTAAKDVQDAADRNRVRLIDITPAEKD